MKSKQFLKKSIFTVLMFVLIVSNVYSQVNKKTALDYYTEGQYKQNLLDWYGAIELYQEALRVNNSYGQAWLALAQCTYALGEYELVITYLNNASKFIKNQTVLQNLKGFALIGMGKVNEARAIFADVLSKYPNDNDARFGLAELDILNGKISGAESYYLDALKRQPENRKALLSLSLVSYELGKTQAAKKYINQALQYHSESPEVHYFAGYLYAKENQLYDAENHVRSALKLSPSYDAAYELLASILYSTRRYQEVIDICDYRVSMNRNLGSAWYMKGVSLTRLNRIEEALNSYITGLQVDPDDELMRTAMEQLVVRYLNIEDDRRPNWARWHIQKAKTYASKYMSVNAKYEYKRALTVNPLDLDVRLDYADILLRDGYPEAYLSQLEFTKSQGKSSVALNDGIESYTSLLRNSLANRWDVKPFYLDKIRYNIGLYFIQTPVQMRHPDSEYVTAQILSEVLSGDGKINAESSTYPVASYAEAFRFARQKGQDYFGIIGFEENDRELTVSCTMYVARTGSQAADIKVYRSGNDRYASALRRIKQSLDDMLPNKGNIIKRNGSTVLIDMGKLDGIAVNDTLSIIKKGDIKTANQGIAVMYDKDSDLGTVTVTSTGDEISQGTVKQAGFYDKLNVGDEVLVVKKSEEQKDDTTVVKNVTLPVVDTQRPVLIRLIQSINW